MNKHPWEYSSDELIAMYDYAATNCVSCGTYIKMGKGVCPVCKATQPRKQRMNKKAVIQRDRIRKGLDPNQVNMPDTSFKPRKVA